MKRHIAAEPSVVNHEAFDYIARRFATAGAQIRHVCSMLTAFRITETLLLIFFHRTLCSRSHHESPRRRIYQTPSAATLLSFSFTARYFCQALHSTATTPDQNSGSPQNGERHFSNRTMKNDTRSSGSARHARENSIRRPHAADQVSAPLRLPHQLSMQENK